MTGLEEDQEFDFDFLFEFNQSDEGAVAAPAEHYSYTAPGLGVGLPLSAVHPSLPAPCHNLQSSAAGGSAMGYGGAVDSGPSVCILSSGGVGPNGAPALESPRIEITSYLGLQHNSSSFLHEVDVEDVLPKRSPSTATLNLPSLEAYRDPSCLSPASSLSSRSCNSEASSYESSFSYPYASPQTSPWQSPCVSPKTTDPEEGFPRGLGACGLLGSPRHSPSTSPRTSVTEESWLGAHTSRPSSPCNKRKYGLNGRQLSCSPHPSPTPSPQGSPRVSVTDDTWLGNTTQYTSSAIVAAINALSTDGSLDLGDGVPLKARKTTLDHSPAVALKVEPVGEDLGATPPTPDFQPDEFAAFQHIRKGAFCDQYLSVPQHPYPWARPRSPASYTSPSLPALDWQLPSHSGPYELRIEVQPKSHHRAHYETEGSRGAVKASAGGHPSVQLHGYMESEPLTLQLFIGTADDRLLRPHAFYQVHRITGKTVSTTSHEAILSNTKVLEIPLLPENNMRAIIDCAGILKLRNSDIELRKGETDIGRKNTRVRLVFRVHIPQPNGRTLSLQVASNPIECSQRSAQELPLVEKQSAASGPVLGGKRMVLSGHNFLQDSKVIFVEKAPAYRGWGRAPPSRWPGHGSPQWLSACSWELSSRAPGSAALLSEMFVFSAAFVVELSRTNLHFCSGLSVQQEATGPFFQGGQLKVLKECPVRASEHHPLRARGCQSCLSLSVGSCWCHARCLSGSVCSSREYTRVPPLGEEVIFLYSRGMSACPPGHQRQHPHPGPAEGWKPASFRQGQLPGTLWHPSSGPARSPPCRAWSRTCGRSPSQGPAPPAGCGGEAFPMTHAAGNSLMTRNIFTPGLAHTGVGGAQWHIHSGSGLRRGSRVHGASHGHQGPLPFIAQVEVTPSLSPALMGASAACGMPTLLRAGVFFPSPVGFS
ncbi:hypothetical protein FD754_009007 [Muntiacus muntjak]|uniref:RHD domain-containing protein n=1 Tax=Muntiacus muntjak TaxID=9888 RepID=A0A5N3WT70_MUNMU|nr:hypothetical protein FD754_009007 [Muntiacus muntjak]